MSLKKYFLIFIVLLFTSSFSVAQKKGAGNTNGSDKTNAQNSGPEITNYDKDIFRLSELLGSLGYLHPLCSGNSPAHWAKRIQALAEAEGKLNPRRQELIIGAYNKGYRNYSLTYRACTDNAYRIIERYTKEAERLSKLLSSRYGG